MLAALMVGLGGCIGALLRYAVVLLLDGTWGPSAHPIATFVVNIVGSFAIGLIGGLGTALPIAPHYRLFLSIGILGSFTTFSTFTLDTIRLKQELSLAVAGINVVSQIVFGLTAVWAGLQLARYLLGPASS